MFRGPSGEKKEVPVEDIDYSKAVIETEETEEQDPMVDDTVYSAAENAETHGYAADGEVKSDHAVLVNLNEGTIIAKKGSIHERIYPASMTKIMTILVAAEHLESRESLNDKVTINIGDTDYSYTNDCSAVGFSVDEVVTVNDLFCAGICSSGADAMMALAEYVAGSQEQFVMLMNEKVKKMELDGTHFTNCVGVFHSENYSTLYDMAMIMEAAENNEICRSALACKKYTTSFTEQHPEGIETSNWFLRRIEDKENGQMVMGAKTGFVSESGNCAASYAENQAGEKYICVTAGAWSSWRCIYDHVEIYREVL
ncbi:MAG: D-alanyl-D-alanine carboxypeptidase [Lachnospiraceae bacterium]|nr:D-alanyl-D-alanine carboxypeptidase [Lachnospiraceae bacterium]